MIELYINGQPIGLSDDFEVRINKSIADIRNPETRSSDFTRTLTIPGTSENNKVFHFIFDVANDITGSGQFNPDFDPNKKADCIVLVDGMPQIQGFIRLTEIINNNGRIEYNCTIHGESANLFTDIENAKLSELDFSEYNHVCNIINIKDSWDNQIYVDGSPVAFAYGNGYVWTQVLPKRTILNSDVREWKADDHTPALYAKTIVDKIFANKGYKYTDDSFFNSDRFKRLIVPYSNNALNISEAAVNNRKFQASFTAPATLGQFDRLLFNNDSTAPNFDPNNLYDPANGWYEAPASGKYAFYVFLKAQITGTFIPDSSGLAMFYIYINNKRYEKSVYASTVNSTTAIFDTTFGGEFDLNVGDRVYIVFIRAFVEAQLKTSIQILSDTTYYNAPLAASLVYNATVDFAFFFDDKHTQREMLTNFVRMFNLYVEQTAAKELRFVTRDEFYNGEAQDWSQLLDYDQAHQIVPMGDLQNNPYVFTYKEGTDYLSKIHKQDTTRIYGDRTLRIDNDFVKNEKKIEVTFASTLFIHDKNQFYSVAGDDQGKPTNDLRILYYNGLREVPTYFFYDLTKPANPNVQFYPVTTHVDNPYNMQFDLSFGMPQSRLPIGFNYSNQNLVNSYYYKTIAEIIDKNSKIFKGFFRITANRFATIGFSSLYFFEGQYWRLNKVIDFNPLTEGLTQCEFLLAGYYPPSIANSKPIGVGGQDVDNPINPDFYTLDGEPRVTFSKNVSGGLNTGENYGGGDDAVMMGINNTNQGKYNTIFAGDAVSIVGFDNVTTLHCNDFVVPEGDRVYVENYPVVGAWLGSGKVVNLTTANSPYLATYDDWLILCNTAGGNITVSLPTPSAANKGKMFTIKKTASSHNVTINAGDGSVLIDDATSHTENAKNGYDQVVSDGTQYWILTHGH